MPGSVCHVIFFFFVRAPHDSELKGFECSCGKRS